jgi:hypothetical protein
MMIPHAISYGWGAMEPLTRLSGHAISLAAGVAMLIVARNEPFLFRTGLACAAVVFTAGVIAMSQQNMLGAGLVLAPMFIMMIVTALLPPQAPSRSDDEDERESAAPVVQPVDPAPSRLPVGSARPLVGLASYCLVAFVLAFTADTVLHRMAPHGPDARLRASHAVVDLSDTIALRAGAYTDWRARGDYGGDGTIDSALRGSVDVLAQPHDLEPQDVSGCLSSPGRTAEQAACDPPSAEDDDDTPSVAKSPQER